MAQSGIVTVRVEGLGPLRAKLHDRRADGPVNRFLDRGAFFIEGEAKRNVTVDRGDLRRSIATEPTGRRERSIGTNKDHGPYVEFGTRPHFPPVAPLEAWARRHGMEPGSGFGIARKIAARGTKPQPFMEPAARAGDGFIRSQVPVLAAEVESAFAK